MSNLNHTWLVEGSIDFEYKKYLLLAYLQHVEQQFQEIRLFPYMQELQLHFENCTALQRNKDALKTSFPKKVKGLNFESLELDYEELHQEEEHLCEISDILNFAIPQMKASINRGTDLLNEVGANIFISPLGIVPLRTQEGYLLVQQSNNRCVQVYYYQLALYNNQQERYLKTEFMEQVNLGRISNIVQLKLDLVRKYKKMPNPAAYVVESRYDYPLSETLLPVAKKLLLNQVNVA